jgi:mono/diheme cytochrome c family protein
MGGVMDKRISSCLRCLSWICFAALFADSCPRLASGAELAKNEAKFYRAINLNGPALDIDGQHWDADDSSLISDNANAFQDQSVALVPPTDDARAQMIRSSRWGTDISVKVQGLPSDVYQVFLYCWEDSSSEKFSISLNGKTVVTEYNSGMAGKWKRLGPWRTVVRDGFLQVGGKGGAANFSGIEIWSGDGSVPDPWDKLFASNLTEDQLTFFEGHIRPLLVAHCYECHSVDAGEPSGGLLLDSRAGIVHGGNTDRVILPGVPEDSLLIKAVRHESPELAMPPEEKLTDEQIADLETWIRMKAPDPRTQDTIAALKQRSEMQLNEARNFWSLKPLQTPKIPDVKDGQWPSSDLDRFVLAKIESAGLAPASDADRRAWIRRATYDLIGLPPSPEEVEAFVADRSVNAYIDVIDRLLASPQYGERWGRRWLDVVRYSDTAGDNSDFPIPQMHHYRDWVIDAFNDDMPYDQFVSEQLAGDLMGGDSQEQIRKRIIATGYIANARRFGSRANDYPQHLTIEDTLDNLGRTFLATTINCARCHNHKFDPITTEDYYALYGIFHSTKYPWPGIELDQRQRDLATVENTPEVEQFKKDHESQYKELKSAMDKAKTAYEKSSGTDEATRKDLEAKSKEAKQRYVVFQSKPWPFETFYAVTDSPRIEDVAVQIKGDPEKTGAVVPRGFLSMLGGKELPADDRSSGRLQLAAWIMEEQNPLTARVIANRIWAGHFGRGIVPTPNDFGRQGKPPTHPELLDWLANELISSGWSIKSLHRTIMLSRTYRMGSSQSEGARESDPSNIWISSFPRQRLDAESIRDSLLLLGGNLDSAPGGAQPFPEQGKWEFTQHNPFKAIYETNKRSVYLMTQRIQRHPYLAIFDGADPSVSTPLRPASTTPLQALYLMNDKFVHEAAAGLSKRVLTIEGADGNRVDLVWRLLYSRPVASDELQEVQKAIQQIRVDYQSAGLTDKALESAVWASTIRSLFRLNEFVYID